MARSLPFLSEVGFDIADLGAIRALVISGLDQPRELAIYDLEKDTLLRLRNGGRSSMCHVSLEGGGRLLLFGDHEILDYRFRRDEEGLLRYTVSIMLHPTLGAAYVAALLPGERVAVANDHGEVHILRIGDLEASPLGSVAAGD